jgi:hypothetical protein
MDPSHLDSAARSLESSLDTWGILLLCATGIVVVGLIMEYWKEADEIWNIIRWPMAKWPWDKIRAFSGGILVTIGVALELYFTYRAGGVESKLRIVNDQTQISLRDRAAANEREAAQLRKDAEGLKKVAEDERLARVKIEAALAFRSLTDKQKHDIGEALARFRKGSTMAGASIWYVNGSVEAQLFADDIAQALRSAQIHTTAPGGVMAMTEGGKWDGPIGGTSTGVEIASTTNPIAQDFADALVKELTVRGFSSKRTPDQISKDGKPPGPVIWVNVEPRPNGPQGEYKLQAEQEAKSKSRSEPK